MTIGTPSYKGYKFHKFPDLSGNAPGEPEWLQCYPGAWNHFNISKAIDFLTNLDETQQKKNLIF